MRESILPLRPVDGPVPKLTVEQLIGLYSRHCAAEGVHGPAARKGREYTFKLFVASYGSLAVADLKPYHLTDFIEAHPTWKSVSSRRKAANSVKAAFNWALRQERIERNPFRNVRYDEAERRPEMPEAVFEALCRAASKPFEAALRFLRLTGCRLGELCAARWCDVDWTRGVLIMPRHKSRRYTGKPKEVVLVGEAVGLLRSMTPAGTMPPAAIGMVVIPASAADFGSVPIFLNTFGRPWTKTSLNQQLLRLKAKTGIQTTASLHGLRHRLASAMLESGATTKETAEQLGHTTTAVLEKHYFHRSRQFTESMRAALERATPKK